MLGGGLWVAWAIMVARKPEGCVGSACDLPGRSTRGYGDLLPVLAAAVLLIVAGCAGLVLCARAAGRFGQLGRWGLDVGVAGAAILAAAVLVQEIAYGGDFQHMPIAVIPAVLALSTGFLLFAVSVLQVVPRWTGALLFVGALALIGVNDQNERILLAVPFGIGWMGVGYALWASRSERPPSTTAATLP
ncbi:MAG: hypothetical protein M3R06_05720 [Chloroflexota bacterium]|nr:hypothetical protein [Chloroflexota bacterium]